MDTKEREIQLLDLQLVTTFVFIASLIISIYITYSDKISIQNNVESNTHQIKILSIFNRTLVVVLTLVYLYISFENRKVTQQKKGDLNAASLQVFASEISLVSTLIVLYVVLKTSGEEYSIISGSGNPNL